ncbi:MAG TPA: hypothetical protein VG755_32440 [Nannocystaceae bacterium]|nr:hypothetical protein [Nannocystaceae bacterium]
MTFDRRPPRRIGALTFVLLFGACHSEAPEQGTGVTSAATGIGGGETSSSSSSSSGDGTTTTSGALEESSSSTAAESSDDGPMAPKLDIGPGDTDGCADDDICCVGPGELPPHALLDAFIAAYPPEAMPHNLAQMQGFVPGIDEAMMAYAALNTGDELVDAENGGLTDANLEAGRTFSKNAAMAAVPADAVVADIRDDPPQYENLGGAGACYGVGWAWGSILFDAADGSIGELVYLYVGYCNSSDGDSETFNYSDQAVQICAAPD